MFLRLMPFDHPPVCVLKCRANSSDRANRFPQLGQEQGKGRSPETDSIQCQIQQHPLTTIFFVS